MDTQLGASADAGAYTLSPVNGRGTASVRHSEAAAQNRSFDALYIRRPRPWLVAILVAYAIAALVFAIATPAWQAPDEPAHYNYISHLAVTRSLPVLRAGDYDQELLNALLNTGFDPGLDVSALRYESHQPPLYYLLAAPVYWVSGGNLLALRLFGILIGAGAILLLYLCLELVFPSKTLIVVGATAFAALLPMHVAMSAAVNNDGLAELLVMASMLVVLAWMQARFYGDLSAGSERTSNSRERQMMASLGVLIGLGVLTKVYAYALAPILLCTVVTVVWLRPRAQLDGSVGRVEGASWRTFREGVGLAMWTLVPAVALGSVWWIRNSIEYGGLDLLGMARHTAVVEGQPRTADWIAIHGWVAYGERAISFTFRSFWGVFGWMGVFMDQRIYTACLIFTGIIFLGVLWATVRLISGRPDADMDLFQLWVLGLFGVMLLAVGAAYLWYNVNFVQHQGRYFFWGLLPISAVAALGWREVMQPLQGVITGLLGLVLAVCTVVAGYVTGTPGKWTVLTIAAMTLILLCQPLLLIGASQAMLKRLPAPMGERLAQPGSATTMRWARTGLWALPFVALFVVDLTIPSIVIVPQLTR